MPELNGQTLGKYQLIERLGRGGMADVYKAYQPGLERYVAVKVLHPHLADEEGFITRFKREAKSVASLRHPHIINVFDFDVSGESYYMVMDFVEGGKSLKEVQTELASRGERLPLVHTLDIVAKLADALDYAHKQGMVHRDVKPSNILLPSVNQPVLADFGIARIIGQTGLTGTGAMIGTPAYMSPEQGRGESADERSDIYALGIVLYEMLTGKPPYDADTPYGVILKHINDPITSPRLVIGNLPPAVEAVAMKALAKSPDDRYQSAGAMADALKSALRAVEDSTDVGMATPPMGIAAPAHSASTERIDIPDALATAPLSPPRAKKPANPLIMVAGVVVALVVVGIVAVMALNLPGRRDQPPVGVSGTEVAGGDQGIPGLENESEEVQALVDEGFNQLDNVGDDTAALAAFQQALDINPDSPEALSGLALTHMSRGEEDAAAEAIFHAEQVAPDHPLVNLVLGRLYSNTSAHYDAEAARDAYTRAIDNCGDTAWLCANALGDRASVLAWSLDDAEAALADATAAIEQEPDPENLPNRYSFRSDVYYYGLEDADSAFADLETAYGLNPGSNAWLLNDAARIAIEIEDFGRAMDYYERLLDDQAGEPLYIVGRGYVHYRSGDLAEARSDGEQALAFNSEMMSAEYLLGLVSIEEGSFDEAMGHFQAIREQEDGWYNDQQYWIGLFQIRFGHELYYDMARATYAEGDTGGTLDLLELAVQHEDWAMPYILKAQILTEQGDLAGAREAYLAAYDRAYSDPELQEEINGYLAALADQ